MTVRAEFEIFLGSDGSCDPVQKKRDDMSLFTPLSPSCTTMAPHRIDDSDSDSGDEAPAAAAIPAPKKPRASRDDVSGNETFANRTRDPSSRKPSKRQSATEKENLETAQKRLADAEKAFLKLRKKVNTMEAQPKDKNAADDGPESEDNDFDEQLNTDFTSSIKSLGQLPVPPPRTIVPLRKTTKGNATKAAAISSQAFKALPELAPDARHHANTSPPPPSPTHSTYDEDEYTTPIFPNRRTPLPSGGTPSSPGHAEKRPLLLTESSSTAPPPKRKKSKVKEPQLRDGFVPGPRAKPNASDYEPIVEALLLRACAEYSARCVGLGSFPPMALQYQWADECFNNSCTSSSQRYKLLPRMIKVITKRGSHVRGKVVDTYRPVFRVHYGFQRGTSKAAITANKAKAEALLKKASFHYKDPVTRTGYGENQIILDARPEYLFKNKKSLAAVFPSYFNPISVAQLALEFTILQSLTQEYSTGIHIPVEFTEKDMHQAYLTHVADIEKWIGLNPVVTEKLRRKWYKKAAQHIAPAEREQDTHIDNEDQDALRMQLDGRTGDTDSENEDDAAAGGGLNMNRWPYISFKKILFLFL
ncbi:hypothetical protein MVEN_01278900 [Mycena venus]|uniref:DUF6532 domain-containing protein n=1 Tax=Mycena venus TaxID=2733690 RepID=A0A8H6Y0M7_9AGAR|nr:hypothetical protein MVEN_01278900 [Mycena venus]